MDYFQKIKIKKFELYISQQNSCIAQFVNLLREWNYIDHSRCILLNKCIHVYFIVLWRS